MQHGRCLMHYRVLVYYKSASTTIEPCCNMWKDLAFKIAFAASCNKTTAKHQINAGLAIEMLYLSSQILELQDFGA